MKGSYSFCIDTDRYAASIEYHMERCTEYHTSRCGKMAFVWFIEKPKRKGEGKSG
jgi:hypothetical protein